MNHPSLYASIAYGLWGFLLFIWIIFTFTNKRTAQKEGKSSQIMVLILLFIGFAFVFNPHLSFLIVPFKFHVTSLVGWVGIFITACGVALATSARFIIGGNWSGVGITLKENHKLVTKGAYSIVRHPIYTGLLLAAIGTMIAKGTPGDLGGIIFLALGFLIRIPKEEKLMSEQFPNEYPEYKKQVKALMPFLF